jgi:hypothetical protein
MRLHARLIRRKLRRVGAGQDANLNVVAMHERFRYDDKIYGSILLSNVDYTSGCNLYFAEMSVPTHVSR